MLTNAEKESLLKYFPSGVAGVDLETTGLSPLCDEIIEIAVHKLLPNGKEETFEQLIKPKNAIPKQTIDIHGITDEMVNNSPAIEDVIGLFHQFVGDTTLVAHNAQFDVGFLVKAMHILDIELPENEIYDSCQLARSLFKKRSKAPDNFKLSTIAEFFEIPLNHHRALEDSKACLRIFANCLKTLPEKKPKSFLQERSRVFNIGDFRRMQDYSIDSKFDKLIENIPDQKTTYIRYKGGTFGNVPRPIRPIGLLPMPKGPILFAQCLLTEKHKSFILRKIIEVLDKKPEEGDDKKN